NARHDGAAEATDVVSVADAAWGSTAGVHMPDRPGHQQVKSSRYKNRGRLSRHILYFAAFHARPSSSVWSLAASTAPGVPPYVLARRGHSFFISLTYSLMYASLTFTFSCGVRRYWFSPSWSAGNSSKAMRPRR